MVARVYDRILHSDNNERTRTTGDEMGNYRDTILNGRSRVPTTWFHLHTVPNQAKDRILVTSGGDVGVGREGMF